MNGLYLSALHPALSHPPLPRFPCTRCLGERSRAIVIQYCQTWRRSYNPSGFLVSRLPGVMVLLGMDVSSSLSKYPFQRQTLQVILLVSISNKVTAGFERISRSFSLSLLLNSEEAKSTTWLHPVSGEAVITGHRKTPGKDVTVKFFSYLERLSCSPRQCVVVVLPKSEHFPRCACVCEREAVIYTPCFLTHEWVFVARAVKIEPSRAHLCPASATSFAAASPQGGQSVELKSGH